MSFCGLWIVVFVVSDVRVGIRVGDWEWKGDGKGNTVAAA